MPVHKSDAGWRRLNKRVRSRERVRVARMDHRVRSAAKPRSVEQLAPDLSHEAEVESVSWCADCDGPCACE